MIILFKVPKSKELICDLCGRNGLQTWSSIRRHMHDNDDTPPRGGAPLALHGPLPASIVFPMKFACGGER
jgi:hypothetical protein